MKPGATTFAVMLRLPSSRAIERARPDEPGLAGRVVGLAGRAEQPDDRGDEDHPARAGADHLRAGPLRPPGTRAVRLASRTSVKSSSFIRISSVSRVMPALLTSTSTGPWSLLDLGERAVDGVGVGDVALHAEQPVGGAAAAVGDRHRVALLGEGPGDGQADPPVAAGHQHRSAPRCHSPAPSLRRNLVGGRGSHPVRAAVGGRHAAQRFRPQIGQAPGPWAASTFSAMAICWLLRGQVGPRRRRRRRRTPARWTTLNCRPP